MPQSGVARHGRRRDCVPRRRSGAKPTDGCDRPAGEAGGGAKSLAVHSLRGSLSHGERQLHHVPPDRRVTGAAGSARAAASPRARRRLVIAVDRRRRGRHRPRRRTTGRRRRRRPARPARRLRAQPEADHAAARGVGGEQDGPVRVWVGGDSMGGELGWALGPMLEKTKVFKPILYYKESSGICRWDFFDWGRQMETVMQTAKPRGGGHHDGHQRHAVGRTRTASGSPTAPEWKRSTRSVSAT